MDDTARERRRRLDHERYMRNQEERKRKQREYYTRNKDSILKKASERRRKVLGEGYVKFEFDTERKKAYFKAYYQNKIKNKIKED